MPTTRAAEQDMARIDGLIAKLESLPETTREPARALLELVLDIHGAGLKQMMELIRDCPDRDALLARFTADERVAGLLLLHGLHPDGLDTRVRRVIERLHPHVGVHGLRLEAREISDRRVRIRVCGDVRGKAGQLNGLQSELKTAIYEVAPEVGEVEVDGLKDMNAAFVPVSSVRTRSAISEADDVHASRL